MVLSVETPTFFWGLVIPLLGPTLPRGSQGPFPFANFMLCHSSCLQLVEKARAKEPRARDPRLPIFLYLILVHSPNHHLTVFCLFIHFIYCLTPQSHSKIRKSRAVFLVYYEISCACECLPSMCLMLNKYLLKMDG